MLLFIQGETDDYDDDDDVVDDDDDDNADNVDNVGFHIWEKLPNNSGFFF